ncbi:MAG TPA: PD-(D/E)XK nuclease family protein, partial [Armatimonadota bacterium]
MRQNGTAANPCSAVKAASRVEGDDSQPVQHELDRQALEDLVTDAEALGRLEHRLNRLNIFEAAGMVRQELRHSDFLAFLLDPLRQHGLGDLFATRLLQKVLIQNRDRGLPVSPIDLDVWSLDGAFVLREWSNIDLLLVDKAHRLAVIIENKVDSLERPGQLAKYLRTVGAHYPDCDVVPIFLTPDGTLPAILDEQADPGLAHASESYIAVGYRLVVDVVEEILWERSSSIGADLNLLLAHYAELLRIHLVGESDIDSLCQTIYQKHRRALDLIYERRPDRQALIHPLLEGLVQQASGLEVDHSTKTIIRFVPTEWRVPALLKGDGTWTPSGMMLLFWFENS